MTENESLGGDSQHSNRSSNRSHSYRSSTRSNQSLVSAQELSYDVQNPEQTSIEAFFPEESDDDVVAEGFSDTVTMTINPGLNLIPTGISCLIFLKTIEN